MPRTRPRRRSHCRDRFDFPGGSWPDDRRGDEAIVGSWLDTPGRCIGSVGILHAVMRALQSARRRAVPRGFAQHGPRSSDCARSDDAANRRETVASVSALAALLQATASIFRRPFDRLGSIRSERTPRSLVRERDRPPPLALTIACVAKRAPASTKTLFPEYLLGSGGSANPGRNRRGSFSGVAAARGRRGSTAVSVRSEATETPRVDGLTDRALARIQSASDSVRAGVPRAEVDRRRGRDARGLSNAGVRSGAPDARGVA